jgi:hypothetical protein
MSKISLKSEQNERRNKFIEARKQIMAGVNRVYLYKSKALNEFYERMKKIRNAEFFHPEYIVDPTGYQYDMEMHIFLNYDEIRIREMELNPEESPVYAEHGATLLPREEHLINACSIRWPEKHLRTGEVIGSLAVTPWLKDLLYGISNYQNTIVFGGAGQGKTYGGLAFGCMLYDHFIYTQSGAQVSVSTVSETKLSQGAWNYLNVLYNTKNQYKYSNFAQRASSAGDYTFRRKADPRDKQYIKEGGMIRGVLLAKGIKDSRVVDKLTGSHSCIARLYILDEGQSTDSAPMDAYTNMYLHPKYKFFIMSGNYDTPTDLLGVNTIPPQGIRSVDESTHMWEGKLKSLTNDLGHTSLVIHYNNDLSPAILDKDIEKKYGRFMPTMKKKLESYPTEESRQSIAYKRFWIGFFYEKEDDSKERIIDDKYIKDYRADQPSTFDVISRIGSFDSAPSSTDRNPFVSLNVGLDNAGYPVIWPESIDLFTKPQSKIEYYDHTTMAFIRSMKKYDIPNGNMIMDFTQYTALLEMLNKHGVKCHPLIYHQSPPKGDVNEITGMIEKKVPLPLITLLTEKGFEKTTKTYAHQRVQNRISLGAYAMRMFIEAERVRGLNESILDHLTEHNGFEKEFLSRSFVISTKKKNLDLISIETKDVFKSKYKFSPDILDCFFQAFYLLYVIFEVRPHEKGLGKLGINNNEKIVDKPNKIWDITKRRF